MNDNRPQLIGPYRIRRKLADGGMGQLFLAQREMTDGLVMECVVKTVRPNLAPDPRYGELFLREARISACLRHQNIVQVFDYGRDDGGGLYLAMEYVAGRNLQQMFERLAERGERLAPIEALRLAMEVLKGLEHAHERRDDTGRPLGIVHRDLTPNNILISSAGEVKIADFGIAKVSFAETTDRRDLRGKFHYMAPEQIEGRAVDARADLFLVGIVLYEALTGVKPFEADSIRTLLGRIARGEFRDASEMAALPDRLCGFLRRALQVDAAMRFQSAREMLDAAERILSEIGPGTTSTLRDAFRRLFGAEATGSEFASIENGSTETRTGRHRRGEVVRRRPRWMAIGLFAILLIGVALWIRPPSEMAFLESEPLSQETSPAVQKAMVPELMPPAVEASIAPAESLAPVPMAVKTQGEQQKISQSNSKAIGLIVIGDLHPYARIFVDGQYFDDTPTAAIPLPPGVHEIKLVNPNYQKTATVNVRIDPGQTHSIFAWP